MTMLSLIIGFGLGIIFTLFCSLIFGFIMGYILLKISEDIDEEDRYYF